MRRLVPLLLLALVLAACPMASEDDTTTTPPLAEPSTTTVAVVSTTTTTESTSTTTVEGCRERDGVLRNPRGFVCPPHLIAAEFIAVGTADTAIHLPGTYEARLFTPPLRFTRTQQFHSAGERLHALVFDLPHGPTAPYMDAASGEAAGPLATWYDLQPTNRPDDWIWVEDIETTEAQVGGHPATVTTFTANCLDEAKTANAEECFFTIPGLDDGILYSYHGERTAVIAVTTPEPVTILVASDQRTFDTYWNEVAQPILDSIEFIDQ